MVIVFAKDPSAVILKISGLPESSNDQKLDPPVKSSAELSFSTPGRVPTEVAYTVTPSAAVVIRPTKINNNPFTISKNVFPSIIDLGYL